MIHRPLRPLAGTPPRATALLLALAAPFCAAAAVTTPDRIPADAHMAFWVEDISEARKRAAANAFGQFLSDPNFGVGGGWESPSRALRRLPLSVGDPLGAVWDYLLPTVDLTWRSSAEATTSVLTFQPADVLETFSGRFAVYSTNYDLFVENQTEIVEWDVVLMADFKPEERPRVEAFAQKLLATAPKTARRTKMEYEGVEVNRVEYFLDEPSAVGPDGKPAPSTGLVQEIPAIVEYTYHNGTFLIAEGRGEPLKRALRVVRQDDAPGRLAAAPGYRRAARILGDEPMDYGVYIDVARHIRETQDFPGHAGDLVLATALGLKDGGPILGAARVDGDGFRIQVALGAPEQPRGLFALVKDAPENTLDGLRLLPPDATSFGSLSVDAAQVWDQARAAFILMNPNGQALFDVPIKAIEAKAQVNLREDLLAGAKGEILSYLRPAQTPAGPPGSAFLFPLSASGQAPTAFNKVMTELTSGDIRMLDLAAEDVAGVQLWRTPDGSRTAPSDPFTLAAAGRTLLLASDPAEARAVLRRLGGDAPGSVDDRDAIRRLLKQLPREGLRGFMYTPGAAILEDFDTSRRARSRRPLPDRSALEKAFGDSWWVLRWSEGGIRFDYRMEPPAPASR